MVSTYSDDGGVTWSQPKFLDLKGAPPHFMLHSSGALIMSYSRRIPEFGERAAVSYDFGETWQDE